VATASRVPIARADVGGSGQLRASGARPQPIDDNASAIKATRARRTTVHHEHHATEEIAMVYPLEQPACRRPPSTHVVASIRSG
jgi:hypothetical protein